ncbi:MAG: thiazolylpeptide-type bacteriocin [Alphaproteobacteria bacterium]|nr:thiazolylpeptide-type bacteriocin [Alphaproteobacteria bacterium]MBV9372209.1 thiazolylpeptide-type bacteriocin [Alphaproteobacteria bacterium]MBV9901697.1 thiazolylpeptide-type bacteriocin [Alphaproteobacteria bacterium]
MKQRGSAVDLSDIDLGSIDLFDVEILEAADTMAVPETGASPSIIYSCSCSYTPPEPGDAPRRLA